MAIPDVGNFTGIDTENKTDATQTSSTGRLIFVVIISLTITVENVLLVIAPLLVRSLRTIATSFVMNLAIADFLVGIILVWKIIGLLSGFGCEESIVSGAIVRLSALVSIWSLSAIAVDRYIAVALPLRYKTLVTVKRCAIVIISMWVFTSMYIAGCIVIALKKHNGINYSACHLDFFFTPEILIMWASAILLSIVVVIILYALIFHQVVKQLRNISLRADDAVALKKTRKSVVTFMIVVGTYCICWAPILGYMIYCARYDEMTPLMDEVRNIGWFLGICNSACNPPIYWWRLGAYRKALKKAIAPCSKSNTVGVGNSSSNQSGSVPYNNPARKESVVSA